MSLFITQRSNAGLRVWSIYGLPALKKVISLHAWAKDVSYFV